VSDIWYYADADGQVGPLSLQELRQELAASSNANDVLVWCEGFPDWKPARDVTELRAVPPQLPRTNVKAKRPHDPVIVRGLLFLGIVAVVAAAAAISVKKPNEVESLLRAANQGGAEAQNDLGIMYENGSGVPQDYATAVAWYHKAADQGFAIAQYNLGTMYEHGEGVLKDDAEAVRWYRKAADQGDADAKEQLAAIYARFPALRGQEVKQLAGETKAATVVPPPPMPEAEKRLITAVEKARAAYATGANEMAQGAARPARAKEICTALKDLRVSNWLGEVETLSSNSDGLGVLSIGIASGISTKTWNNAISDFETKTLIDPESAVFKEAIALSVRLKTCGVIGIICVSKEAV
jgi:hypothetical protein